MPRVMPEHAMPRRMEGTPPDAPKATHRATVDRLEAPAVGSRYHGFEVVAVREIGSPARATAAVVFLR